MLLKIIKEVKYVYDNILNVGEIVELLKEYDNYYLIKTEDNIKMNIMKHKAINVI